MHWKSFLRSDSMLSLRRANTQCKVESPLFKNRIRGPSGKGDFSVYLVGMVTIPALASFSYPYYKTDWS